MCDIIEQGNESRGVTHIGCRTGIEIRVGIGTAGVDVDDDVGVRQQD